MKINSVMANNAVNMYNKQKQHTKIEMGSKQLKDKVEISKDAKYLNKINNDNEEVNLEKINEIKQRIKSGTYNIDSRNLAKAILKQ
ncbi:MAG: flagellar biosynthesis anti-sigma factor FlgM [Clostridium sp.]|uniref:flagellar biosynthesis anti-sigma factor FlgM n=1 Tax=Clostridium sp. TaxID=1506 RepID=UPI00399A6F9D